MNRRAIGLIAPLALGILLAAFAPEAHAKPGITLIGTLGNDPATHHTLWKAFRERLHELGYVEGRDIAFMSQWFRGRPEHLRSLAMELVRIEADVIVTAGTAAALAVSQASRTIPIVMATAGDPVTAGLVNSLAAPGGNVTGLSNVTAEPPGKRLELVKEAIAQASRVAVLHQTFPGGRPFLMAAKDFAAKHRLPALYGSREYVEAGGLMSYGVNFTYHYRRAADYVESILKGTNPADLPVEQPRKFELVINLKTANGLGLTLPPSILSQADEVIP